MDNFIVSARKYRPLSFKEVVGQKAITSTLQNAIKSKHLAQAFLFTGPRGVGKTTCARILAKTINCENLTPETEACDKCESCTSFNNNASFNIHELDAASNNSVDDIRNLVEQVRIPPQVGNYKVYIIDEVHMLSQAAFNAFLKTLEEPPPYAKFILATTEKHKILPTILSRCQIFDFRRINVEDITDYLQYVASNEGVNPDLEALNVIAQKADGALRDALSTFDQIVSYSGSNLTYKSVIDNLNILDYEYFFRVTYAILKSDVAELLSVFDEIIEHGFDGQHFIMGLSEHLRSLLVLKNEITKELLQTSSKLKDSYLQQAAQCSPALLMKALEICNKYDLNYKASSNKRLHIEIALMQLGQIVNESGGYTVQTLAEGVKPKSVEPKVPEQTNLQKAENKPAHQKEEIIPRSVEKEETVKSYPDTKPPQPEKAEEKPEAEQISEIAATAKEEVAELPKESDAVVEKPNVVPTRNEDNGRKIKRISIKDSLRALKQGKEEEQEKAEAVIKTEFSQEQLVQAWKDFVVAYQSKSPSFASAIGKYLPTLKEDYVVEYKVDNRIMANDILHQSSLMEFLKTQLNNNQIKLKSIVPKKDEKKRAYFDKEKFEELAQDYPGIVKLKEQLDLDFGV